MPSSETPAPHEGCNCRDNKQGDVEDGHATDYESTNAYNELLTRCNVENSEGDTCSWQCRDCHVIMHQQHQGRAAYSPAGGGGGGGGGRTARLSSDDYNCTTETYLPSSDVDHDHTDHRGGGGGGGSSYPRSCHRQRQHQQRSTSHQKSRGGGAGGGSRSRKERDESCKKAGCECRKEKSQRDGEKRSRKDLIMPAVSFSKAGTERVDIHSPRSGSDAGHCCRGGGEGGGCLGGALRCCNSANSSPVENERRRHRSPRASEAHKTPPPASEAPTPTRITVTQHGDARLASVPRCHGDVASHACDVKHDDVMAKPEDGDSGHGVGGDGGSAGREGSSTDDGVTGMGAGSVETGDGGGDRGGVEGGAEAFRGDSLGGQGHAPGAASGCRKTASSLTGVVCRRGLDKSEHLRFFTDSLAAHPHACRSNSLVELTQTSQAKLTAHLHPSCAAKRLSLTPRQEGYLLLSTAADDNSPYLDDDEDPEFPPYEELQRYLHANKQCKGRAHALDRGVAPRDEVCGLLEENASPCHTQDGTRVRDGGKSNCSTYDKESGFSSEY